MKQVEKQNKKTEPYPNGEAFCVEEIMIITSEQVSNGHPDKICDQISDAVLTVCLEQDKNSRVAVETLIKDNHIVVAGEMKTTALFDLKTVIRNVVKALGMENIIVTNLIGLQSDDISQGVDTGGAGDQGMMYGYATDETDECLPLPYVLATRVLEKLMELQHPLLGKDAKAQVSYDYDNKRITTFLVSIQHSDEMTIENLRVIVKESMILLVVSFLVVLMQMLELLEEKLTLILMVDLPIMVVVHFQERIQVKWIAQELIWHVRLQKTSFVKDMLNDANFN